jgi:NAD(P)H-flavin reductase
MFQETGSLFTKSLSDALLILKKNPPIEMNGFYGSKHLLENVSRHDCVIMIAGGIGIVAHLSLLQNLVLAERRPDVKVY